MTLNISFEEAVGYLTEGFISLGLGNVIYRDAEGILKLSIDFLARDGKKVEISI